MTTTNDVVNAYDNYAKRNESLREQLKHFEAKNKALEERVGLFENLLSGAGEVYDNYGTIDVDLFMRSANELLKNKTKEG